MDLGRLLLRSVIGGYFVAHGTQKLFGWFGGHGIRATAQHFEGNLGVRPGVPNAVAAGAAEAGGGAALALGAGTPLAGTAIVSTMLTAIRTVHLRNGPFVTEGGYEYNLVLIAAVLALVESGPGRPSVDDALGGERRGTGWMLASLGAAIAGAAGVQAVSSMLAPRPEDADGAAGE